MIDINRYLAEFPGSNKNEMFFVIEINQILLNIMPNICCKQAYAQVYDCASITFKASVRIFKHLL